jgi:cytochrome oxidase Cu insertion factor (SCO1/SenC/PrrC family)
MTGTDAAAEVARGRKLLVGLAALFFVPLAFSFYLYYIGGWRPAGTTNHGELISPARPLATAPFTLPDGATPARGDLLTGKWTLMYIGDGACAADCQKALWVMRQTRQLLAEDMSRVQRVFLAETGCCDGEFLAREHVGLEVVRADATAAVAFIAQFPRQDAAHTIYVIDPLGNLMMRFDARQNPKGLLTDLGKLLKLSHIG